MLLIGFAWEHAPAQIKMSYAVRLDLMQTILIYVALSIFTN